VRCGRASRGAAALRRPLRRAAARPLSRAAALCAIASLLGAAGCASGDDRSASARSGGPRDSSPSSRLEPATCPPEAGNCRSASGRVVYVERVDPDGDGDAHFVLASRDSITAPGITAIDVKRSLRPSPLPGVGDRLSAAGPVYRGSYGQRQIEAVELHVARSP
jgi:hypothetical protein